METLPPAAPLDSKWYQIWMDVWAHPGEEAFRGILKERDHRATRGFIWVAVTSLIVALVSIIGYIPLYRSISSQAGNLANSYLLAGGSLVTFGICSIILTPIAAIIGLAISSGIYHLVSKLFGSSGSYGDLIFCMAAVSAPAAIISSVISIPALFFTSFPAIWWLVVIFISILAVVVAIYVLVLQINAIRGAESIGTWQAILTVFLPVIVVGVLSICCFALTIPAFIQSIRQ